MKTANGILTLIQEYAVDYHDGYYAKATANQLVKLRTAIEELHRDAARYRFAKENAKYAVCIEVLDPYRGHHDWVRIDEEHLDAAMKEST